MTFQIAPMAHEDVRNQHLQRALNGLRQLSTSLRSVSGSLGTAVPPGGPGSEAPGGISTADRDRAGHARDGSRCLEYNAQVGACHHLSAASVSCALPAVPHSEVCTHLQVGTCKVCALK